MRIRVQDAGILCDGSTSPGPTHNAAFPNLLRCPDGSILAAHRVGSRKDSADGTQRLWRSRDEGATWSPLVFPFTRTPAGGKDFGDYLAGMQKWTFGWPSGVVLRDGNILAAYYRGAGDRCSVHLARVTIE